jgi:glutamyl-tRNA synthetase
MHIGTVRTALFNFLFAKHHGGTFFVRIEDTDKERDRPEWTEAIWKDFEWCGLTPDIRYVQSDHAKRHAELLKGLVEKGIAYVSKEAAKDDPAKEVGVVRLKNPGKIITFNDIVRGEVTFDTTELGDFVIARSMSDPLYHFAVVVDDHDAGVTHVIRAEEHISNTPRQILIQEALGLERPEYAHIPLILAPDRSKLSKRKHGASVENYRNAGFLPEAILNYLSLLGWNPGTNEELFSLPELIERFTLDQVQKSGAIFDETKLKWFNREYILRLSPESFLERANGFLSEETRRALEKKGLLDVLVPLMRERIQTFGELKAMDEAGEFSFYANAPQYDAEKLAWKDSTPAIAREHLTRSLALMELITKSDWSEKAVKGALWPYAEKEGRGAVLWPLRFALSGREKSPDPFTIAGIIGKDETEKRIASALERLS